METEFPWDRYWLPKGHPALEHPTSSYVPDPATRWGRALLGEAAGAPSRTIRRLDEMDDLMLVALEGDVGVGKSRMVRRAVLRLRDRGEVAECIEAAEMSAVRLEGEVIRLSTTRTESGAATLFIDGVDESDSARELPSLIRLAAQKGVRIRIVCRSAAWPEHLLDLLVQSGAPRYEPLSLTDGEISLAAELSGIDPSAFLGAVRVRDADELARRPLTLVALLDAYKRGGLPRSKTELFEAACVRLTREWNLGHRDRDRKRALTTDRERLAILERFAAFSVFTARPRVLRHAPLADADVTSQLAVEDVVGGREFAAGKRDATRRRMFNEAAEKCGLLSTYADGTVGFSHRSYAEFLAARYARRSLAPEQVRSLLTHPEAPNRVPPQLRGVAGWLAGMDPNTARWLAEAAPGALLECDLTNATGEVRRYVLRGLIRAAAETRIAGGVRHHHVLRTLGYPGIARDLEPWIRGKSRPLPGRLFAIDAAAATRDETLVDALLATVVNEKESTRIRAHAVHALAAFPKTKSMTRLKKALSSEKDPDFEIRAGVLEALWPAEFPAPFEVLSRPARASFSGAYSVFLSHTVPQRLRQQPDLLVEALRWVGRMGYRDNEDPHLESAEDRILTLAWERANEPEILTQLAKLLSERLTRRGSVYPRNRFEHETDFAVSDAVRRRLAIEVCADGTTEPKSLVDGSNGLLRSSDLEWALEQAVRAATDPERAAAWAEAALRLFHGSPATSANHESVIEASQRSSAVRDAFAKDFEPIMLGSPEEAKAREIARLTQSAPRAPLERELARLRQWLERVVDNPQLWNDIAWLLQTQRRGNKPIHESGILIAVHEEDRQRLVEAARRCIVTDEDRSESWIDGVGTTYGAVAGSIALQLLHTFDRPFVMSLPRATWRKWCGSALIGRVDASAPESLLRLAYAACPKRIVKLFGRRIVAEGRCNIRSVGYTVSPIWDERFEIAALDLIADDTTPDAAVGALLSAGLGGGSPKLVEAAFDAYARARSAKNSSRAKIIARQLLTERPDEFWARRRQIGRDANLAEVFEAARLGPGSGARVAALMSADRVAEMHLWLARVFPPQSDPADTSSEGAQARFDLKWFRNDLANALANSGTTDGLAALERIRDAMPRSLGYSHLVHVARERILDATWTPVDVATLRELFTDRALRRVDSSAHLHALVLELLAGFERELQGAADEVATLWNQPRGTKPTPKNEKNLSQRLAVFLERGLEGRAVRTHREVEIRRKLGPRAGQLVDILVEVVQPHARFATIIEVKADWNRDVKTAMKTQLVDRYLRGECPYGVYVVGFFKGRDSRASDAALLKLRALLDSQATALSTGGLTVASCVLDCRLPAN